MSDVVHLVPAGRPIGRTACGLETETPDRSWRPGLIPDENWMGPLGEITCGNCIAIEQASRWPKQRERPSQQTKE